MTLVALTKALILSFHPLDIFYATYSFSAVVSSNSRSMLLNCGYPTHGKIIISPQNTLIYSSFMNWIISESSLVSCSELILKIVESSEALIGKFRTCQYSPFRRHSFFA